MGAGVSGFLVIVTHPRILEPPTKVSAARDVAVPLYASPSFLKPLGWTSRSLT